MQETVFKTETPNAGVGGPAVDGIAEVPRASQSHSGCKGASSRSSGDEEQPGHSGAGVGWMSDSGLSLSYDDDPHGSSSSSGPRSDESSSEESESDLEVRIKLLKLQSNTF